MFLRHVLIYETFPGERRKWHFRAPRNEIAFQTRYDFLFIACSVESTPLWFAMPLLKGENF